MNSYGFLAGCYDEFTTDVDYAAWAEYIQRHFERADLPGSTVLDLPAAPAPSPASCPCGDMR